MQMEDKQVCPVALPGEAISNLDLAPFGAVGGRGGLKSGAHSMDLGRGQLSGRHLAFFSQHRQKVLRGEV